MKASPTKLKYKPVVRVLLSLGLFLHIVLWIYILVYLRRFRLLSYHGFRQRMRRLNEKNARRVYRLMAYLEGLFIKVGQFISTRFDILPKEYTKELARLQDEVPPRPFEEMRKVIEGELGKSLEEVFEKIDSEPVASASLAQVHHAILNDGREVAVKVQYPNIDKIVRVDLKVLKIILRILSRLQNTGDLTPIYREFERYISWELDFVKEGHNADRVRKNFSDDPTVIVPEVIWELTRPKLLVLEYIHGVKVTDKEAALRFGFTPKELMEKVVSVYFTQILKHGFFQADPHPGNIFVCPDGKIALLDFGLSKELAPGLISGLMRFVQGVANADEKTVVEALWEMGFSTKDRRKEGLEDFARFVVRYGRGAVMKSARKLNYQRIVQELVEMSRKNPMVRMPTDLLLLGRVFGHLMGLGRYYKVRLNFEKILADFFPVRWRGSPGEA